jgi:uncharacterized protein YndB with AHSA1/START domain
MGFQNDPHVIRWRLHLAAAPDKVHEMLATDAGRARFWATSAVETNGVIDWRWPESSGRFKVIENTPQRFVVEYFGHTTVAFTLASDGGKGTDLTMTERGLPEEDRVEALARWVSLLMALKAAVDFGVDLRNRDGRRTWRNGFVDN